MKASEKLKQAKELIMQHWSQRVFVRMDGASKVVECCALGACHIVDEREIRLAGKSPFREWLNRMSDPERLRRGDLGRMYLMKAFGPSVNSIEMWNDAPGRTKEEVLALFDKAIAMAEADEAAETQVP